jgi:hypothetical protein
MSDEDKAEPAKSVMGNLPSTRPTRMARRRDGDAAAKPVEAPPKPRAKAAAKPARAKPRTAAKPKTAAKARPAAKRKTPARPKAGAAATKPRAVRSGSPSLDAAKKKPRAQRRRPAPEPPKGAELVTTAVQATGELAKIGVTLGRQALKRAARRLPKP